MTSLIHDPELEGFLTLLAARRAPRTVEAYRRDLSQLGAWLEKSPAAATTEDLERWIAQMRADGNAATTIARRIAAVRAFFRHELLLGRATTIRRQRSSSRDGHESCRGLSRPARQSD